jgi:hypothetical protein
MMPDALATVMELLQSRLVVLSDELSAPELVVCDIAVVANSKRSAKPMAILQESNVRKHDRACAENGKTRRCKRKCEWTKYL